jgi:hypothetical protein
MSAKLGKARTMVAIVFLILTLALAACGGSDDGDDASADSEASSAGGGDEGEVREAVSDLSVPSSSTRGGLGSFQIDLTADDSVFGSPKVIKNGQVSLKVDRGSFDEAVDDVYFLATRMEGIVKSTAIDDSGEGRGTVIIRVPSDRFEDAVTQLADIGRIESQHVDTQDVTDEFVDLESRIRNARAAERVLLNLMNEATTIADTIRVQNQLERVQENIERMRGRLRVLEDETSFSTLAVDVIEAGAPAERSPEEAGTIARAWNDAVEGFMIVIAAVIVASGVLLPVAVLALIVVLLVRRLWPTQA